METDGDGSGGTSPSRQGAGTKTSVPRYLASTAAVLRNYSRNFTDSPRVFRPEALYRRRGIVRGQPGAPHTRWAWQRNSQTNKKKKKKKKVPNDGPYARRRHDGPYARSPRARAMTAPNKPDTRMMKLNRILKHGNQTAKKFAEHEPHSQFTENQQFTIILLEVWSVARKYVFNPPKIRFLPIYHSHTLRPRAKLCPPRILPPCCMSHDIYG
jgi:hypothetical protein